jgi:acyl-CoA thioester hydrolase
MAKPDPALLDAARYPFSCEINPRFGDLDVNRHINNVALAGMFEDARVRFHAQFGYHRLIAGMSMMVASAQIEYLDEGRYPQPITIHCAVEGIGRSSHRVITLARQEGLTIGFARTTVVTVGSDGPAQLPEAFRDALLQWQIAA